MRGREHGELGAPGDLDRDLGRCSLVDFDADTLARALALAESRGPAASTVRRLVATLSGFTRWLNGRGHLTKDPLLDERFQLPAAAELTAKALEVDDISALLRAAAGDPPPSGRGLRWPVRDTAILEVLARCGLRAEEVCNARVSWIDRKPERPVLRVIGKGGKRRSVPFGTVVDQALSAWLEERKKSNLTSSPGDWLFVRRNGTQMSTGTLDRMLRSVAAQADVVFPEGAVAHSFRHYFGGELARRYVHIGFIAELLGHTDTKTTQIYTKMALEQLIGVMDDAGML